MLVVLFGVMLSGCNTLRGYASGQAESMNDIELHGVSPQQRGALRFVFDDLNGLNTDTLETNAMPWKIAVAALMLDEERIRATRLDMSVFPEILQKYGFLVPDKIGNWIGDVRVPVMTKPLGVITGRIERRVPNIALEVANLGCATCHAGVLYDSSGQPGRTAWLGLPNTSINLEAYTQRVYASMQRAIRDPAALLATLYRLYPETDLVERRTLEEFVMPRIKKRLAEIAQAYDAPAPFSNGGPGMTNGVASLKLQLGVIPTDRRSPEYAFTSIPDLGAVLMRSSLLYDGVYAAPGTGRFAPRTAGQTTPLEKQQLAKIITFFTVPTMGVPPATALGTTPRVEEILTFLENYESPRFPGPVNMELAVQGSEIYKQHCAVCHGDYNDSIDRPRLVRFPNRLSSQLEMNTDDKRWRAIDAPLIAAIGKTGFSDDIAAQTTGGYVAPRLTALWATAPYLHNGSVPTLWHLMNPGLRPEKFYVGGHKLDFEKLGIAGVMDNSGIWGYPADYSPWSMPMLYDTREPGHDNGGHEKEFTAVADADAQRALLEYLKLL